jgi:hypothetical protein
VYKEGLTVKEAAIELNINYGTAKTIIRVFKTTGRIDRVIKNGQLYRFNMDSSG